MGDMMVRQLLVGSAHYILGPFGPDTDLRRYGLRLSERGGKNAKKRAVVAVARKLAVLLHCLWVSGEVYEPLRHALPKTTRKKAERPTAAEASGRARGSFPNPDAALKLLFLALEHIAKKWTMPVQNWKAALQRFAILLGDRVPQDALV